MMVGTVAGADTADAFWGHHRWGCGWRTVTWGNCGWGAPAWGWGGWPAGGCGGPGWCGGPVYGGVFVGPWYGGGFYPVYANPIYRFPRGGYYFGAVPGDGIDGLARDARWDIGREVAPRGNDQLASVLARVASVEARRKAERLLAEGDELFRSQNFHFALQKYKLAASAAPDLAETHWRKGHALVATRNYDLAAKAFKRAIALQADVSRGRFRLNELYGGAAMTKTQHVESLAEWALANSDSADAYFLLGVFLHYDGEPGRAAKFFAKAADLAGVSGGHVAVFQAQPAVAPVAARHSPPLPRSLPVAPVSAGMEL